MTMIATTQGTNSVRSLKMIREILHHPEERVVLGVPVLLVCGRKNWRFHFVSYYTINPETFFKTAAPPSKKDG